VPEANCLQRDCFVVQVAKSEKPLAPKRVRGFFVLAGGQVAVRGEYPLFYLFDTLEKRLCEKGSSLLSLTYQAKVAWEKGRENDKQNLRKCSRCS
jgi:hypothetical protein